MYIEAWLSLVERRVRDAEAAGSNPVASTKLKRIIRKGGSFYFNLISEGRAVF